MPRYLVERTFPDTLDIPMSPDGAGALAGVVEANAELGVTWIHSYVTSDRTKTVCIYDGPTPEAIRRAAAANGLPIDSVAAVAVLDPYFYLGSQPGAE